MYKRTGARALAAVLAASGLLLSMLAGCARASAQSGRAAAETEPRLLPREQGAQRATFALG